VSIVEHKVKKKINKNIIEMRGITKHFENTIALNSVDLNIEKGKVLGLIGENGAGKSTLINILCGLIQPDEGEIRFNGTQIKVTDSHRAKQLCIVAVHQHVSLVPLLTVAENIFMGNLPRKRVLGLLNCVNWEQLYQDSKRILERIGFSGIDVKAKVNELSIDMKQEVQITRAISQDLIVNLKVLILDEPSAILSPVEIEKLFTVIKEMKERGVAIVYVSHYLDEIKKISDRISVLKNGECIANVRNTEEVTKDKLINMMTGERLNYKSLLHRKRTTMEELLTIKELKGKGFEDVNFSLHKGEILGIIGLVGSGKIEIARTLFGLYPLISGKIFIKNQLVKINSPKDAILLGIGLLPQDRQSKALVLNMTIRENVTMASCKKINHLGFINIKKEKEIVQDIFDKLKIKASGVDELVRSLSGGNQQKVSFAKWLFSNTDILILEEPTEGIDVGAKVEMYNQMQHFVEQGKSIILISSEIPEILRMSDNILILKKGSISAKLSCFEATEERIFKYMI